MRGHELIDLVDHLRTGAKEEATGTDTTACSVCGERAALIVHRGTERIGFCLEHFINEED